MNLTADINQTLLKGNQRVSSKDVRRVLEAVSKRLRSKKVWDVSIGFVSEKEIQKLNEAYRGKNAVTDVLSFENGVAGELGEVLICFAQAKRQAKELKHSVRQEILFLLVHGLLHLYGFDHEKPADAKKMFPLQKKILDSLGIDSTL